MSGSPAEPEHGLGDEAAHHAAYLDHYRETVVAALEALDAAEQRASVLPSGWTPVELLSHLLHMEQRWFVWGFLGEQVADPWGDWNVEEPWDQPPGSDARWQVADDVAVDDLVARLRAVGERTRAVLEVHDLEEQASPGGRFADDPPDLRWICFHVIGEYARHAAHLDVVVELLTARRPG